MKNFILSTFVSTILLFLWSGVTQMLPWGVPTAQNITVQSSEQAESFQAPNLIRFPPNSLTTEGFDEQFVNKVSTYTTDTTFSWIVTQPLNTDYTRYFMKEGITQLIVALFLSILLQLTVQIDLKRRIAIVIMAGFAAVAAIYGQLMNWWSLPATYALGAGLNLVIGWTLAGLISARFILKTKT